MASHGSIADRLERLERELAHTKRLLAAQTAPAIPRNFRRARWPAVLLYDLMGSSEERAEIYAWNGTTTAATGVEVYVRQFRTDTIPAGTRVFIEFHSDGKWYVDSSGGEAGNEPVRFELAASLSLGGSAAAKLVAWDGADYVTGADITVRDFTADPGTFRGIAGYRGWAVLQEDRGDYEIIGMEMKARAIEFRLNENMGATTAHQAKASIVGSDGDFWWGKDPQADMLSLWSLSEAEYEALTEAELEALPPTPELIVYDDRHLFDRALAGAKGLAIWDEIEDHYQVIECESKAGAIRVTIGSDGLSSGTALGNASAFSLDDSWGSQQDILAPVADASLSIKDDGGFFTRALPGAKAIALLDAADNVFRVVQAKSKAGWIQFTTTGAFSGSPLSAAAAFNNYGGTQQDTQSPGSSGTVVDLTGNLAGAPVGTKGVCVYDNINDRYIAVPGIAAPPASFMIWSGEINSATITVPAATNLSFTELTTHSRITHSTGAGYSELTINQDGWYKLDYSFRAIRVSGTPWVYILPEFWDGASWNNRNGDEARGVLVDSSSAFATFCNVIAVFLQQNQKIRMSCTASPGQATLQWARWQVIPTDNTD